MPEGDKEVVHEIYERLNEGDVDGVIALCSPDLEMDMSERVFNPDTYSGEAGIRRFYQGVRDAWETYRWDVEDMLVSGDSVVAMLHCHGQSREGGPDVDWRVAWVWRFRGVQPISVRFYREREAALEAAGLRASDT